MRGEAGLHHRELTRTIQAHIFYYSTTARPTRSATGGTLHEHDGTKEINKGARHSKAVKIDGVHAKQKNSGVVAEKKMVTMRDDASVSVLVSTSARALVSTLISSALVLATPKEKSIRSPNNSAGATIA